MNHNCVVEQLSSKCLSLRHIFNSDGKMAVLQKYKC